MPPGRLPADCCTRCAVTASCRVSCPRSAPIRWRWPRSSWSAPSACCSSWPDRVDLVAGELRCTLRLLPAVCLGRLVLHRARTRSPRSAAACRCASARWCSSSTRCAGGVCRNWATIGRFPRTHAISRTPSDALLCAATPARREANSSPVRRPAPAARSQVTPRPVATKSVADWPSIDVCANYQTGDIRKTTT
jgi:hypothetical protein